MSNAIITTLAAQFNAANSEFAERYNSLVAQVTAAQGEKVSARKLLSESTDSEVRELIAKHDQFVEALAKINAVLDTKADEYKAAIKGNAESAKETLRAEQDKVKEFNKARRAMITAVQSLGLSEEDIESFKNELVSVQRPKGSAGNSGIKRPRFESITVNGEELDKATLTALVAATKVGKDDVDKALYAAAGVGDLNEFAGDIVEFSIVDDKGNKLDVIAEPKKSEGAKPATDNSEDDDDDNADEDNEPTAAELDDIDSEFDEDDDE